MAIFILCCERSGSTLLRLILDTHPQVAAPGELGLGELCHRLVLVLSRTVGQLPAVGDPAPVTPTWWQEGEPPETPVIKDILEATRRQVEPLMVAYAKAREKSRWCAKAASNLPFANLLRQVFPRARFLCLYRNGLDVARSCLQISPYGFMKELADYVAATPGDTLGAMLRSWIEKTGRLLRFEREYPHQCLRVRYEDFVAEPEKQLELICDFLELAPSPGLIQKVFRTPHHRGGGDPKIWDTSSIRGDRVGAGRMLPREQIHHRLVVPMNELFRELGYEEVQAC